MTTEEPLPIFPTKWRSKHSKLVAFPVGAENLSRALDGVPQHGEIACVFSGSVLQQDVGKTLIYVMSVGYTKHARNHSHSGDAALRGVFDPRWEIWTFTVPATMRADIKTLLLETGLPDIIRPWLIENENITGKTGSSAIAIEYNVIKKRLETRVSASLLPDRA